LAERSASARMSAPMLNNLRTVLRESYVGHVMCAAFMVVAIECLFWAFGYTFANSVKQLLNPIYGNRLPFMEWDIDRFTLTVNLINAAICTALAVLFRLWLLRGDEGDLHDGTN
jgi:hypothetical protein